MSNIIALDPGLGRTGYGVMEKTIKKVKVITYGCITTAPKQPIQKRLSIIFNKLDQLATQHKPKTMILESLFFNNNQKTAIAVGQAQGAMLLVAARHQMTVEYVTPLQIKMALTGYGRASKSQIQKMVTQLLGLKKVPTPDDTADALACGLTYLSINKLLK